MNKITSVFDRINIISEFQGFKNIRNFAIDGLGYISAEKIYRLRDKNNKPSTAIMLDISNKVEKISLDWLITGERNMLKSEKTRF